MSTNQLKAQREPLITALREIRDAATAAGRRRLLPLARTLWAISGVPDRRWRFVSHALPITTDRTSVGAEGVGYAVLTSTVSNERMQIGM
jgi:hypothetical protein